ncbi:MAG: acyl-phosphate glycerol 3-phosphate acyltransferase, partial [Candidatus Aminicenantes bacterium]|nr:acyl-phosphate glycerol 3-phosphate acyltransferase [Candidatus Aminicenantes bacterium]
VGATRFVSAGSVLAAVLFPVFALLTGAPRPLVLLSLPVVFVILVRHTPNIGRLFRGKERKLGQKADLDS